jgi:chromosome segregation ATPase
MTTEHDELEEIFDPDFSEMTEENIRDMMQEIDNGLRVAIASGKITTIARLRAQQDVMTLRGPLALAQAKVRKVAGDIATAEAKLAELIAAKQVAHAVRTSKEKILAEAQMHFNEAESTLNNASARVENVQRRMHDLRNALAAAEEGVVEIETGKTAAQRKADAIAARKQDEREQKRAELRAAVAACKQQAEEKKQKLIENRAARWSQEEKKFIQESNRLIFRWNNKRYTVHLTLEQYRACAEYAHSTGRETGAIVHMKIKSGEITEFDVVDYHV